MIYGLLIVANDFSTIFFGDGYYKAGNIIIILCPTILFSAVSNTIRTNYLIPMSKDDIYIKSTMYGAIVNIILNLILIRRIGAYGACIGTLVSEFIVMIYQVLKTRNNIPYINIIKVFQSYIIKGGIMSFSALTIKLAIANIYVRLISVLFISIIVYFIMDYRYIVYDFFGAKKKNYNIKFNE